MAVDLKDEVAVSDLDGDNDFLVGAGPSGEAGDGWFKVLVKEALGYLSLRAQSAATVLANLGAAALASPAFTGNPTAPTPTAGNNTTRLATTAFVTDAVSTLNTTLSASLNAAIAGLSWKTYVVAASTGNVTLASAVENGDTLDGVTLATGDRILLKDQTTGSENGIYVVAASGAPTRATDADTGSELVNAAVSVRSGTTNADKWFKCTNDSITLGTTSVTFVEFASTGGGLLASNNLSDVANAGTSRTNLGLGTANDVVHGSIAATGAPPGAASRIELGYTGGLGYIAVGGVYPEAFSPSTGDAILHASYQRVWGSSAHASPDVGLARNAAGRLRLTNASTGLGMLQAQADILRVNLTGNTTLVQATHSGRILTFTGTGNYDVTLWASPATGDWVLLANVDSADTYTVKADGGTTITTIAAGATPALNGDRLGVYYDGTEWVVI